MGLVCGIRLFLSKNMGWVLYSNNPPRPSQKGNRPNQRKFAQNRFKNEAAHAHTYMYMHATIPAPDCAR